MKNNKIKRLRRRNNKKWINDLFIWERLRALSTPIMFKKDDLVEINFIPNGYTTFTYKDVSMLVPAAPKITQLNDVNSYYKKTFGYRMNHRLSRTKQKELMEKVVRPNRHKKIIFMRKGIKSIWKI